jgi:LacI family transcriptional regulator
MTACVKCGLTQEVLKAGFVRGKQRYFCKACECHFTEARPQGAVSRKSHQATLNDAGRAVGVAASTVSRALNGHSDISPTTRQAVLEVARQLGYQPNLLAQNLKTRSHAPLALLFRILSARFLPR